MSPSTTRRPPAPPPPPPPPWTGYAPATAAVAATAAVPRRKVGHGRLFLMLGAGLGVLVLILVVVALVTKPDEAASCAPPACAPQPPTGPPVAGDHHFTSTTYHFTLDYFENTLTEQDVEVGDDGISLTYPNLKGGGSVQIVGMPAEGRDAQAVVDDVVSKNFAGAEQSYVLPGASVGYRKGYGAVYDLYPQSTSGSAERDRVIVMAAVKDDLAIVAAATGQYYAFTPDGVNVGHASAANLVVALFADDPINTVRWPGDPAR